MSSAAGLPAILLEQWADDPLLFCHDVFSPGQQPRGWQREFLDSFRDPNARRVAVAACRGAGKSRAGAYLILWWLATRVDSLAVLLAPVARQVRNAVMVEVRLLWADSATLRGLFPEWEIFDAEIKTGRPAWRLLGLSSDEPANIEGLHSPGPVLLLVDEARQLEDRFWSSAQGMLTHPDSLAVVVGTPGKREGFFYRAMQRDGRDVFDRTFSIAAEDVPEVRERYEAERRRLGEEDALFKQQWEATFADVSEFSLFDPVMLRRAQGHDPDAVDQLDCAIGLGKPRMRRLGLDPARTTDACVLAYLEGRRVVRFATLPRADEMETATSTLIAAHEWRAREIGVDTGGLGHGVAARLRQLTEGEALDVHDYVAAARPYTNEHCANRKTELLLGLRDALLENPPLMGFPRDCPQLVTDLLGITLTQQRDGRVRTVDPKRSPDHADAVCAGLSVIDRPLGVIMFTPGGF